MKCVNSGDSADEFPGANDAHKTNFKYKGTWLRLIKIPKFYEIKASDKCRKDADGLSNSSKFDNPEKSFDFYNRSRLIGTKQAKAQTQNKGKESSTEGRHD